MAAPIALQLYTVREAIAAEGFAQVVTKVAQMGYAGVEPAGFPGTTPAAGRQLFDDLGLAVSSAHTALPLGDKKNEVVDLAGVLGTKRIVSSTGRDQFSSADSLNELCDTWNEAATTAAENGLELGLHNHWWEFSQIEGRSAFALLEERLDPSIHFQLDTYWAKVGGDDPVEVVRRLGARAPLLHIKDGPADDAAADMVAAGAGAMDFPAVVAAADAAEWLIIELDRCGTDMLEAVRQSCEYMVNAGLAQGR